MKTKRSLIIYLFISLGCSLETVDAQSQWIPLNAGTSYNLEIILFINDSTGFVAGNSFNDGVILKTTDGGIIWDSTITNIPIYGLSFVNESVGYTTGNLGGNNELLKTIDNGSNWTPQNLSFEIGPLLFTSANIGYIANSNFNCYKTIDSGNVWISTNNCHNSGVAEAIYFTNDSTGYIAGWYPGSIAKTTDAGATWTVQDPTGGNGGFTAMHFPSLDTGYAVSWDASTQTLLIYKTIDAGSTWLPQSPPGVSTDISSIYCPDNNICFAVGDSGTIIKTTDGGNTWVKQGSGTTSTLNSIYCTSNNICYAVGDSGLILKTVSGGVGISSIPEKKTEITVYPNPNTGWFTLGIDLKESTELSIKLYHFTGQLIHSEVIGKVTGDYTQQMDLSGNAKGIYYVQIMTEKGVVTRKVVYQ